MKYINQLKPKIGLLLFQIIFMAITPLLAQNIQPGILYFHVLSDEARPDAKGSLTPANKTMADLFSMYQVTAFEQAAPFARTLELHNVYYINCLGDVEQLKADLEQSCASLISNFMFLYEPVLAYEPEDFMWRDTTYIGNSLWYLYKIQADSAWEITRSSDSIDVAFYDHMPDPTHPELATKLNMPYNPLTGGQYFPITGSHGHTVAGFIAAETAETGETALGPMPSIGFNSMLYAYGGAPNTYTGNKSSVYQMLHASTVMGAEVISISFFVSQNITYNEIYLALKEILDNGTVIVAAAGNNDTDDPQPVFNGLTFDEIIVVSGTDSTDHFAQYDSLGNRVHNFAHYPSVDLCAPGYNMMGLKGTLKDTVVAGDTVQVPNIWPYYHSESGSSFATPITAGVAALIKSINPCLTSRDVEYILKTTVDPIIDADSFPGEVGTGRLNAYKAVKLAKESYEFNNYTIHNGEDITWNTPHFIDTLIVEPGGKLTITEDCFFNEGGVVIVDTTAFLYVNYARLTTTCRNMWYGIEVWGNAEASQFDYNDYCPQGRLILDGAIIENAEEAVRLWKPDHFGTSGGYVIATNSTFRNNKRAVEGISYHNYDPQTQTPYRNFTRFENCTFSVDEEYHNYVPFLGFVTLLDMEGVKFNGCDFYNNSRYIHNESGTLMDDSLTGFGIYSIDAGYSVNSHCNSEYLPCPPQSIDSSRFIHLKFGIHAKNSRSNNTIDVENSQFYENITGIYTSALIQPTIVHNSFFVNAVDTSKHLTYGGLYLDNYTTGFVVQENEFSSSQGFNGSFPHLTESIGICVNNSGDENNLLYNNRFEHLLVGILAQNHNRDKDGIQGLKIGCNEFYTNEYDVAITALVPTNVNSGIKYLQGSDGANITDPAGNIFSPNLEQVADAWDIYDETNRIQYWYHAQQNGYDLLPDSVSKDPWLPAIVDVRPNYDAGLFFKNDACPSLLGTSGGSLESLKSTIAEMGYKTDSVSGLLALLTDGGETEPTVMEVASATGNQTMDVRDDLLEKSPYLSDTVLITTVLQEEALPAAIVTEVLLENPQSAKSDEVMDELYAREDITDNQIDQIEANALLVGAMESLKISKDHYAQLRDNAFNQLMAAHKQAEGFDDLDSIKDVLHHFDFPTAKYQLALLYLNHGELQKAQDTLSSIATRYPLTTDQQSEHNNWEDYMDIMVQLEQNGHNIFGLSAAQKAQLYQVYQAKTGQVSALAMNLLQVTDTLSYQHSYVLPTEGLKNNVIGRQRNHPNPASTSLKVYPNPAGDYLVVEYPVQEENSPVTIKVVDNNGFLRLTTTAPFSTGSAVLDTRSLGTGTYICHVSANGKLVGVTKFVVY